MTYDFQTWYATSWGWESDTLRRWKICWTDDTEDGTEIGFITTEGRGGSYEIIEKATPLLRANPHSECVDCTCPCGWWDSDPSSDT